MKRFGRVAGAVLAGTMLGGVASAANRKKVDAPTAAGAVVAQPAVEALDLPMYDRIRQEEIFHSHVMEYSSALFDGIGPRLTGSPNMKKAAEWTRDQLTTMGCAKAQVESWGDFGMGWRQVGTSVMMTAPDTATFLAQSTPWSPATQGAVKAEVIAVPRLKEETDLAKWKGKLKGKVVLYGDAPKIEPLKLPAIEHDDPAKLRAITEYPLNGDMTSDFMLPVDPPLWEKAFKSEAFKERVAKFLAEEGAAAVLIAGGANGAIEDDTNMSLGWWVYRPERKQAIPSAVIANEAWGRMSRLLEHKVPVAVELTIATEFTGDHEPGLNTIAEIPGADPKLKAQVVMLGGHLDSWIAGTGATDNGAGVVVAMEAMRILRALNVQPRRTIRIGLWGGEEEGIFGSLGYVREHFGSVATSTKPEEMEVPEFLRERTGAPVVKPEHALLSAYFNVDNGQGRLLGIYAQGNGEAARIFEQWGAPLKDLGFTTVSLRDTGSTDHVRFDDVGLPGFQFIQDPLDYDNYTHHTNQDVYERMPEDDLKQQAIVMATFVYDAAMRDAMMPRKAMPHPEREMQQRKPLEGLFPGVVSELPSSAAAK